MRIVVYKKWSIKDFRKKWINTLHGLGLLSGDPEKDYGVIGEIIEYPEVIYLDCPDLPEEALEILKEYFGKECVLEV